MCRRSPDRRAGRQAASTPRRGWPIWAASHPCRRLEARGRRRHRSRADAGTPYQALYRRYRPQRFADVLGQEHVTRALRHAVRDGKVAHAYLFSGPRGTGKTSTARILAMALNCEHPVDGEPDGTCPSCVAIRQGSSLDVQELDSATNRGIDEMRDLLGRVALGTPGRWKVYIIDEVHQMTSAAASALLKTLEEPPGHVIFVLATTDPQKVLPTIRSRTQHFEFRLLGADVLATLLRDVNDRAALGVAPEAIDLVVRRGHGSARDALSALDQVAAAGGVDDEATILVRPGRCHRRPRPGSGAAGGRRGHCGGPRPAAAGDRSAGAPAQRVPGHPGPVAGAAGRRRRGRGGGAGPPARHRRPWCGPWR